MRKYAQIQIAVWNDTDFRALTPGAQHLYFVLISHPSLLQCGVGDWKPKRLVGYADHWDMPNLEAAAGELIDKHFILVDIDTDEFLVRSYVRNDGFMKQPNLATAMARSMSEVGSSQLRGVVVFELNRLQNERPELKGFTSDSVQKVLSNPSVDPSGNPCGNPYDDPSGNPSKMANGTHRVTHRNANWNPSGNPSVDPCPTPSTYTPNTFPRGAASEGVKGVRGKRGNQTAANDSSESEASNPPPQNLDELAAAHAARTRCPKHQHIPAGEWVEEDCRECQKLRQGAEAEAERERETALKARQECDLCDPNGMRYEDGQAWRCDHQPETAPKTRPEAPQTGKQHTRGQSPQKHKPSPKKRQEPPF